MTKPIDASILVHDDKRPRDGENAREPSSRRPRNEHRWLAPPGARRQPRVGAEYQIMALPVAGSEQGRDETVGGSETEIPTKDHTDISPTIE